MEDTNNFFNTSQKPSILDVKPVEELEVQQAPKEEDLEIPEINEDDKIFVKQPKQKPKKKLSERQKKHLENMRKKRQEKAEERKRLKAKKQLKPVSKPIPIPQKDNFSDMKPQPKPTPKVQTKPQIYKQKPQLSNEEYLKQFLGNVNLLMDVVGKMNKNKGLPQQSPNPSKKNINVQKKTPQPQVQQPVRPMSMNWTQKKVLYNNYKNPFGI
jgi:hypothetical protein